MKIQFKRGLAANRTTITPAAGEMIYTTDTKKLYIGDGTTVGGIDISAVLTLAKADVGLGNVTNESKTAMFTSPTFTGTVTVQTPAAGDDSTKPATTAWARAYIASLNLAGTGADVDGGTF